MIGHTIGIAIIVDNRLILLLPNPIFIVTLVVSIPSFTLTQHLYFLYNTSGFFRSFSRVSLRFKFVGSLYSMFDICGASTSLLFGGTSVTFIFLFFCGGSFILTYYIRFILQLLAACHPISRHLVVSRLVVSHLAVSLVVVCHFVVVCHSVVLASLSRFRCNWSNCVMSSGCGSYTGLMNNT